MLLTGWVLVFTIYLILEGFSLQLLALRPITFTTTLFSEQLHKKKKKKNSPCLPTDKRNLPSNLQKFSRNDYPHSYRESKLPDKENWTQSDTLNHFHPVAITIYKLPWRKWLSFLLKLLLGKCCGPVMETLFLRMSQLLPFVHIILELHNSIGVGPSYQRAMGVYALLLSYQILGNLRTTLFTLNGKTSKIPWEMELKDTLILVQMLKSMKFFHNIHFNELYKILPISQCH